MKKFFTPIIAVVSFLIVAFPAMAGPISYDIGWVGANGYTIRGEFSFDDSDGADGRIDESELISLSFDGFLNGIFLSSANLEDGFATGFNFNFDPIAETFFVGDGSITPNGQLWNTNGNDCDNANLAFASGNSGQVMCVNGVFVSDSLIDVENSTLTATRRTNPVAVSEPASMALLGLGLICLAGSARIRKS